jgi:hypothetical protein
MHSHIQTKEGKRNAAMQEQHFFSLFFAVTQNYHFYLETISKFYPVAFYVSVAYLPRQTHMAEQESPT